MFSLNKANKKCKIYNKEFYNKYAFRSSLSDCQQALKLQPNYQKARLKAAQCCAKLKLFEEAINYCNEILAKDSKEPTALKLLSEAQLNKVILKFVSLKNYYFMLIYFYKQFTCRKFKIEI